MKRLTKRDADGQAMMDCQKCEADWTCKHGKPMIDCTALYCRNRLLDRLAEYEDTWLEPEQCVNAKTIIESAFSDDTSKAERIRELLKADTDGRVVVLPCKVGDTVWFNTYKDNGKTCIGIRPHKVISTGAYITAEGEILPVELPVSRFGENWFLTREEAEKALEAMK